MRSCVIEVEPPTYYVQQVASYSTTPIPASKLTIGDVFVVLTNGNNTSRVEVLGIVRGPSGNILFCL
jgi:hypothetical protein